MLEVVKASGQSDERYMSEYQIVHWHEIQYSDLEVFCCER